MIKKILIQLVVIIISLSFFSTMVQAANTNNPTDSTAMIEIAKEAAGMQCVKVKTIEGEELTTADIKNGDYSDEGYLITIIEEPLGTDFTQEGEKGKDYEARTCYRNTFQFSFESGKTYTLRELTTECSKVGESLFNNSDFQSEYQFQFTCKEVMVILSKGGTKMIEGYISMIYRWGASLAGIIAVLVIVISGIQLAASGGNQEAITGARNRIVKSLMGIVVLFLSGLILYTINPNFFVQ